MSVAAIPQHSSETNEHPTPREVVEPARRLLGGFDLDPASTAEFNECIGAAKFYTEADDGLVQPWHGRVWLNPPGGKLKRVDGRWVPVGTKVSKHSRATKGQRPRSSMCVWWERLSNLWANRTIDSAFFVGFTLEILRLSQQCPHPVQAFPRCYPRERMAFAGDDPTHGNVLVYLPPHDEPASVSLNKLINEFSHVGFCEVGAVKWADDGGDGQHIRKMAKP